MSHEDVLYILKELLYERKNYYERKVYPEDEFITIICNKHILVQLGYISQSCNCYYYYSKYYCYMKNSSTYYSFYNTNMLYEEEYKVFELITDMNTLRDTMERHKSLIENKLYDCNVEVAIERGSFSPGCIQARFQIKN